jgi:ketosteroid isomerase-like protein
MDTTLFDGRRREVAAAILSFFEAGKTKDMAALSRLHGPSDIFSKFDENPPYTRQSSDQAFVYEQAAFANISDYNYSLKDVKIDILGNVAVASFILEYSGMFVNDYSFEGTPVHSKSRVTMVLAMFNGEWKIVHEHFSRFPDMPSVARG